MPDLDLTVGAEIPPFVRKSDLHAWNRYAAVNDEFVPIHMDDEAGREAGFPSAIGMGNLSFSHLHNALRGWLGDKGRIKSLSTSYRNPNLRKSTVTTHGKIASVTPGSPTQVEVDLWIDDDGGRLLLEAKAVVEVAV